MKPTRKTVDEGKSVSCSLSGCGCWSFHPGDSQLRSCDRCGHGWVAHALEILQTPPPSSSGPVEVALPGPVLDLSSLILYGAQAIPVRLKILLDRLYSVLTPEQVGRILHSLGWTLGDYVRGYVLQPLGGNVLDRWSMVTREEEPLVLEQFLRFGETRPIVELMAMADPELRPIPRGHWTMARGVWSIARPSQGGLGLEKIHPAEGTICRPENHPGGLPFLLPFHVSSSTFHRVISPTKSLGTPPRLPSSLQTSSEDEAPDRFKQQNLTLKIKTEPERLSQSLWDQSHPTDLELHGEFAHQESSSFVLASPPPPSSSLYTSSCSPSVLDPRPSFSSFLCSVTGSTISHRPQVLHCAPSPSSSSVGGRKGRVCCGVCGKSFYDKGTLKIHYNAVHLKIKHGCTVAGCTMVFSSLRSRNRHSANPNPRLHTHCHRTASHAPSQEVRRHRQDLQDLAPMMTQGCKTGGACLLGTGILDLPSQDQAPPTPPQAWNCPLPASPPPVPPLFSPTGDGKQRPLPPTHLMLRLSPLSTVTGDHVRHRVTCGDRPSRSSDDMSKKKSRKSSTPVKIEREALMEEEKVGGRS